MHNNGSILASVIVPVYNSDQYICKCIYSLQKQTVQNIEIIIIDDGSTDCTPVLIEEMAKHDKRIRIIHRTNSGVSAARNKGIEVSNGKYIVFVDSDDYVASDFLDYMINLSESTGADFCISKNCFTKVNEADSKQSEVTVFNNEEATAFLLSPRVIVGCWNKIYKRSFLQDFNIRFDEKLFYGEGLRFITQCSQYANRIVAGNKKVYYYRRNNTASATSKFNINSIYNGELSLEEIESDMIFDESKIREMLILHRSMYFAGAVIKLLENRADKLYNKDYQRWLSYIKENIVFICKSKDISLYRKGLLLGVCLSPRIVSMLNVIRTREKRINSIE